jgi:hypothetical protein
LIIQLERKLQILEFLVAELGQKGVHITVAVQEQGIRSGIHVHVQGEPTGEVGTSHGIGGHIEATSMEDASRGETPYEITLRGELGQEEVKRPVGGPESLAGTGIEVNGAFGSGPS